MNYLKLTFEDIMQNKILYYDKEIECACYDICDTLKIDNMPGYDSKTYYELKNRKFTKKQIKDKYKLQISDRIFEEKNLKKFRNNKHNVLFVFSGSILKGIVHFADYNRNIVLKRIQDDMLNFEMNLREFMVLNGKSNQSIIEFFEYRYNKSNSQKDKEFYKNKINNSQKRQVEMDSLGTFQLFDLSDIMSYCNSTFSETLFKFERHDGIDESGVNIVRLIRNIVMHGKNPIEKNIESSIFSIESLVKFEKYLKVLKYYNSILEESIYSNEDYQKSIKLENKSKLEIIHQHHPRALKYFIGY